VHGESSVRRDIDETLAIGSNQAGNVNSKVLSATEVATAQQNTNTRLQKERTVLTERYLVGCRKFDSLIQRYADSQDYVEIVGETGATKLQAWNKSLLAGRYAFNAAPDSQLAQDAAAERSMFLEYVNFFAKHPFTNQAEVARVGALKFGEDPARMVKQPDPPPVEKPKVSYAIKIEDFYGPGAVVAMEIAAQNGVVISSQALLAAQSIGALVAAEQAAQKEANGEGGAEGGQPNTQHDGTADTADVLSKHSADLTGRMPGRTPEGAPPAQTSGMVQ
jgi:hypothetical protein